MKLDNRHYQTKYLMTFQATVNCSSVKYPTHSCKVDLDPRLNKPIQLFEFRIYTCNVIHVIGKSKCNGFNINMIKIKKLQNLNTNESSLVYLFIDKIL